MLYSRCNYIARALRVSLKQMVVGILFGAAAASAQVITGTNFEAQTFDQASGVLLFDFTGADAFIGKPVIDLSIALTFAKTPDDPFSPPFYQELTFSLLAIDPITADFYEVFLIDQFTLGLGPDGGFFSGTLHFSDGALTSIAADPEMLTPGTYQPVGALSSLKGITFDPFAWGLFIEDIQAGAPLTYTSAQLSLTFMNAVPEPSTYACFGGLLLFGLIAIRRAQAASAAKNALQVAPSLDV